MMNTKCVLISLEKIDYNKEIDKLNIPTKLMTVTYKNKIIESYE
jgi:hypothetical protein